MSYPRELRTCPFDRDWRFPFPRIAFYGHMVLVRAYRVEQTYRQ